jgi:hypothetical protein
MALPPCCIKLNEEDFEPKGGLDGKGGILREWKPFELSTADPTAWQQGGDAFADWIEAHQGGADAVSSPDAERADSAGASASAFAAERRPLPSGCSAAAGVSLYALPQTGLSFLSQLVKHLAVLGGMCRVHEVRSLCAVFLSVACPPGQLGGRLQCSGHRALGAGQPGGRRLSPGRKQRGRAAKGMAASRRRCSFSSQVNMTFHVPHTCCDEPRIDSRLESSPSLSAVMPGVGEVCPADRGAAWLSRAPMEWLWRDASLRAFRFANHTREQQVAGVAVGSARGEPAEPGQRIPVGAALVGAGFIRGPLRSLPEDAAAPPPYVFQGGGRLTPTYVRRVFPAQLVSQPPPWLAAPPPHMRGDSTTFP